MWIYPYKQGSSSARDLAQGLGCRRLKHEGSRFRGRPERVVVNWGASSLNEEVNKCRVINRPTAVDRATSKVICLRTLSEAAVPCVPSTTDRDTALGWLREGPVVVRKLTRASGGRGIEVVDSEGELPNAPLYTKYVKKKSEWRVHIMDGEVIDLQRKVRDNTVPDDEVDWRVRNHDRGFIFQRNDIHAPPQVIDVASRAMAALNLDFGAVDVIFNQRQEAAYVLEVNTAPGLTGTTLETYIRHIREKYQ